MTSTAHTIRRPREPEGKRGDLLDTNRLHDWLRAAVDWPGDVTIQRVKLLRLWVVKHARITFELGIDLEQNGPAPASTKGHTRSGCGTRRVTLQGSCDPAPRRSFPYARAVLNRHGLLGLRFADKTNGWYVCCPDRDRALPLLRLLLDDRGAVRVLNDILAEACTHGSTGLLGEWNTNDTRAIEASVSAARCDLMAYRMGKRCTLRLRAGDDGRGVDLLVKIFKRRPNIDPGFWQHLRTQLAARSDGLLHLPPQVQTKQYKELLITVGIGASKHDAMSHDEAIPVAVAALQTLHGLNLPLSSRRTPLHELQTVCRWVRGLRDLGDERFFRLRALARELARRIPVAHGSPPVPIHRDFYITRLVRHEGKVYLTDLDTLCLGDPELDLAAYSAHLVLEKIQASASEEDAWRDVVTFVKRYREAGGRLADSRWPFYFGCALSRLGAIHALRGLSSAGVNTMWSLAEKCATGAVELH